MSDGFAGGLMLMLALLAAPILMIGLVTLLALPVIAEHDPDVLFDGKSGGAADVPIKVAIAGAALAMCGGFFFAWVFVGELSLGWLFLAWAFWAPAFHLLLRPNRKPRPPVLDDLPWKRAIPRLALVLAFGAILGAKIAGAISANAFYIGLGVYAAALVILNRMERR